MAVIKHGVCPVCGKEFEYVGRRIYCSEQCSSRGSKCGMGRRNYKKSENMEAIRAMVRNSPEYGKIVNGIRSEK